MCVKGLTRMRRSAFAHSDGDTSEEPGRGLKFGEPVVGKVETFDLCPEAGTGSTSSVCLKRIFGGQSAGGSGGHCVGCSTAFSKRPAVCGPGTDSTSPGRLFFCRKLFVTML